MESPLSLVKLIVVVLDGAPGGKGMAGRGGGAGGGGAGAGTGVGAGSGGASSGTSTSQPVTRATRRNAASARTITPGIQMVIGRSAGAPEREREPRAPTRRVRCCSSSVAWTVLRSPGDFGPASRLSAGVVTAPHEVCLGTITLPGERSGKWRASMIAIVERTLRPSRRAPVKLLSLTFATACLLSLTAGCGGNATGPDAVREPPPEVRGLLSPRLLGPAVINGRVVDFDTGQRFAGVKVDVLDQDTAPRVSVTTDAVGGFRLELSPSGLLRFKVSPEGYVSHDRNHYIEPGTWTLEIAVRKTGGPF